MSQAQGTPTSTATSMLSSQIDIRVGFGGRDELRLQIDVEQGQIRTSRLTAVGCPEVLDLVAQWRPLLMGNLAEVPLPPGVGHAAMLMREILLRARNEWDFPYKEEELCHCRAVPAITVDAAIVAGAHTVSDVSRRTSAGTSCGTCQPDIQKVIAYRCHQKT